MIRALMRDNFKVLGGGSGGDGYEPKVSDLGVRFKSLPIKKKGLNPLSDLRLFYLLWRWYRNEKPAIVHHFTIKPVIYGSLAARLAGVPKIVNTVTGLGYVFTGNNVTLIRLLVRQLFRLGIFCADFTFFQNSEDRRYLVGDDHRWQNTDLLPGSGVDCERFAPVDPPENGNRSAVRFLLVARMLKEKGIYEFAEAAGKLREISSQVHFQMLGERDKSNPNVISGQVLNRWQHQGILEWSDAVEDVRPIIAAADVVVLPSYYREGIPRSLLEAAAMGKPVITTDSIGCRETVDHGRSGLLVPARDVDALVSAMTWMIDHPRQRESMGRAGRQKMLEQFDERIVINRILAEYQN